MPTNAELTEQQRGQWSSVASGWERRTDWFERTAGDLTAWLADHAGARPGSRVLDLACGGGEPAVTLAARVARGGEVIATDLSPQMVEATRRRAARLGRTNLTAQVADAQALPFDDASFDAATCRFGLMLCPEPERAAREIRRVLRPSGRFAVAAWDLPERNPFFLVLTRILGRHIELPAPDPTAPGPFRLSAPGELEALFGSAGFAEIEVESRALVWRYESPEQFWQIQLDIASSVRAALKTVSDDIVERIRADVFASLMDFTKDGIIQLPASALCATGRR